MGQRHTFVSVSDTQTDSTDFYSASLPANGFSKCLIHADIRAITSGTLAVTLQTKIGDGPWQDVETNGAISSTGVAVMTVNGDVTEGDLFADLRIKLDLSTNSVAGLEIQVESYLY